MALQKTLNGAANKSRSAAQIKSQHQNEFKPLKLKKKTIFSVLSSSN